MSVREAGQKGGETVKKKYGPEFYEMIGRKGGQATKKAHGHAFYEAIGKKGGKKGGEATRDRYGPEFYETIGQKGGQKVKALIEQGKKAAAEAAEASAKESQLSGLLGVRRTAVLATAFLLLSASWATAQSPQQHVLPAGTAVVFVTDAAPRRRPPRGRRRLGPPARRPRRSTAPCSLRRGRARDLVVGGIDTPDGKRVRAISLDRFSINAGLLPVKSVDADRRRRSPPARRSTRRPSPRSITSATACRSASRSRSSSPATSRRPTYTPTPARTASPKMQMKREPKPPRRPPQRHRPAADRLPGARGDEDTGADERERRRA